MRWWMRANWHLLLRSRHKSAWPARYAVAALAMGAAIAFVALISPMVTVPNAGQAYVVVVLAAAFWLGTGPAFLAFVLLLAAVSYHYWPYDVPLVFFTRIVFTAVAAVGVIILARIARREQERAMALAERNARLSRESVALAARAQQHLAELNALLDSLVEGVTLVAGTGRVLLVNEAGRQLWLPPEPEVGWQPESYSRLDIRYLDGRPMPFPEWPINRALRGERFSGFEVLYIRSDGRRFYLSISGSSVRDEQGTVVMAINVYRDVTQLRELEILKDEFLEVAAHELKTPVAVLKGYAQGLRRFPEGVAPRYRRALGAIDRQTARIDALVRDLLDVSRLRAGAIALRYEPVDVSELVETMANQAALGTQRHKVRVSVPGPIVVAGDRERLEQVIKRLLDNAMRYSPAGGDVEVSVAREDSRVRVAVRDAGIGIPREKQARIFERFYRAHTGTAYDYGGMGVGLYIAREIVRGLGGEMGFESTEGQGSTFYFTLPLMGTGNKER